MNQITIQKDVPLTRTSAKCNMMFEKEDHAKPEVGFDNFLRSVI